MCTTGGAEGEFLNASEMMMVTMMVTMMVVVICDDDDDDDDDVDNDDGAIAQVVEESKCSDWEKPRARTTQCARWDQL